MAEPGLHENAACLRDVVIHHEQAALQHADGALHDAHVTVGDEAGEPRAGEQRLGDIEHDGIVGTDQFLHGFPVMAAHKRALRSEAALPVS